MVTLDTLRYEKKAEILRLAAMRGGHNIRIFGSVARGDNREDSDVDFPSCPSRTRPDCWTSSD